MPDAPNPDSPAVKRCHEQHEKCVQKNPGVLGRQKCLVELMGCLHAANAVKPPATVAGKTPRG